MSPAVLQAGNAYRGSCFITTDRAPLYRYLQLAFSDEDRGDGYRCNTAIGEGEFLLVYSRLMEGAEDLSVKGMAAARRYFSVLSRFGCTKKRATGVESSSDSDGLFDRLSIALEFLQLLCLREEEAARRGDRPALNAAYAAELEFLDELLLPLVAELADLADSSYSALLEATRCLLLQHKRDIGFVAA